MMTAFTPMLAHNPELILKFVAGVFFVIALLHAGWYWFVHQVGFMLASIGTKVELWSKVALPLVLIPISGLMTVCVPFLLWLIMSDEAGSQSVLWPIVGIIMLAGLLFAVPFLLGLYMLRFSLKRSLLTAFFQVLVYATLVTSIGLSVPAEDTTHTETSVEVTECRITSGDAEMEAESTEPETTEPEATAPESAEPEAPAEDAAAEVQSE